MSKGRSVSSYTHTQKQLDDYANQHNPNNHAYWDDLDNHANQCNPNNEAHESNREDSSGLRSDIPQSYSDKNS